MGAMTTTAWLAAVLGCAVVVLLVVSSAARRRTAAEQERRLRLEEELTRARADVATLGQRLDHLGLEVVEARETAERAATRSEQLASRADREFVITSLVEPDPAPGVHRAAARRPSAAIEERLVRTLTRRGPSSGAAGRLVVGAVALGHGVRRALSPEVLDRAAAEATVARRRSRRDRRRDLREARRVVRSLRPEPVGKHVA